MAAFTPYDLYRLLVNRVGWPTESEKMAALESIDQWEQVQLFGNLASLMECAHEEVSKDGKCMDCGRQIEARSWRG
jgi:hypothetical protein